MSNFNIKELNRKQLQDLLVSMGEAKFREKQISSWLAKGVESFDEMTDLSKNLREKLAKSCTIEGLKVELQQI
ncbi:MAG: 23S rRNA (adenine(2503)-C(2))-methyltransferase RlmN, partial [Bacillota bacterium]|nr:23S rRNA (adenine(2503)-C(2))-methyltransferase RlmN [Bacillota bacterium]